MNTLHHFSHQGVFLIQACMAAWAMLGQGLEGLSAGQDIANCTIPHKGEHHEQD